MMARRWLSWSSLRWTSAVASFSATSTALEVAWSLATDATLSCWAALSTCVVTIFVRATSVGVGGRGVSRGGTTTFSVGTAWVSSSGSSVGVATGGAVVVV